MLLRALKDSMEWNNGVSISKGELYIAYAKETRDSMNRYYILPYKAHYEDGQYDPLYFLARNLEIVADLTSTQWQTRILQLGADTTSYTSFPEWFENDFYIRAHDWNLEGEDYDIIRKYKDKYEMLYSAWIQNK